MDTRTLRPSDPDYPSEAGRLARQPPALYLRGVLPRAAGVAVVGTRHPSAGALEFAEALARGLSRAGVVVWSGGADGIDARAHRGALDEGAPTVAVLAGALDDVPYPEMHAPLFDEILARGGALLSLQADGERRQKMQFLQRNELLAALTEATVVVEAAHWRSGALSTAAAARRLGRRLLVVPSTPWSDTGAGCAREIGRGARPVICLADVLAALREPPPRPRRVARAAPEIVIGEEAKRLLDTLDAEARHLDALACAAGLGASIAARTLLGLVLGGFVLEDPPGHFRLASMRAPPPS